MAPNPEAGDYADFQAMAEALLEAKESGLVYEAKAERSKGRETYGHVKQVLVAGGLTPKGKTLQEQSRTMPATAELEPTARDLKEPEILQLRPTFAGMSIDLKALWRKWRVKK